MERKGGKGVSNSLVQIHPMHPNCHQPSSSSEPKHSSDPKARHLAIIHWGTPALFLLINIFWLWLSPDSLEKSAKLSQKLFHSKEAQSKQGGSFTVCLVKSLLKARKTRPFSVWADSFYFAWHNRHWDCYKKFYNWRCKLPLCLLHAQIILTLCIFKWKYKHIQICMHLYVYSYIYVYYIYTNTDIHTCFDLTSAWVLFQNTLWQKGLWMFTIPLCWQASGFPPIIYAVLFMSCLTS